MRSSKPFAKALRPIRHSAYLSIVCVWIGLLWLSSRIARVGVSTGH